MSIESVRVYRDEFLRSETWKTVRIAVLARDESACQLCGCRDIFNDAHHVFYPDSIWDSKPEHAVTLCRPCHNVVHMLLPKTTTSLDEGKANFERLKKALSNWETGKKTLRERERRSLKGCTGPCWFCRATESPYRNQEIFELGLPEGACHQPICNKCLTDLKDAGRPIGNGWNVIRKKLNARPKLVRKIVVDEFSI